MRSARQISPVLPDRRVARASTKSFRPTAERPPTLPLARGPLDADRQAVSAPEDLAHPDAREYARRAVVESTSGGGKAGVHDRRHRPAAQRNSDAPYQLR